MKSIKEIIGNLRVAMTDARQNESHFESWMILNEAICNAIDALAEQPIQQGITLDGMTANEFALAELYAFQEATGCDTADQLKAQPKREQKLEFVLPGGGYVPAIPRTLPLDWKLVPRKATPEMLRAMDECAQEGYDERLYEGMASSVYMAAWDASPVLGTLPLSEKEKSMMDMIVGNLVREGINKHRARELAEHFIKQCNYTNGYCTGRTDLLSEQKAQQQEPEYAWPTVADYERDVGFQTNEAFRIAWNMARTTNRMLGHASSQPAQRTWVGLTDEEIEARAINFYNPEMYKRAVLWAQEKLKERNQ